jgi:polysaccharide deacetylase 2 family uncharacterized protein YibQ
MAVVVRDATAASLPALATLAPLGSLTVSIAPGAEGSAALAQGLRGQGHEVLLDMGAAPAAEALPRAAAAVPQAAGFAFGAVPPASAEALAQAASPLGAMLLDAVPAADSALLARARSDAMPAAVAALTIPADATAQRAFQLLREAGTRAAREGQLVVVLEAAPPTLSALGRWLALPGDARPAPLSGLIRRGGATRY